MDTNLIIFQMVFQIMFFFSIVELTNYYLHEYFGCIETKAKETFLISLYYCLGQTYRKNILEQTYVVLSVCTTLFFTKALRFWYFSLFYCFQNANLFIEEKCKNQTIAIKIKTNLRMVCLCTLILKNDSSKVSIKNGLGGDIFFSTLERISK